MNNKFSALNIKPQLIKALTDLGFVKMSEVQEQAIPGLLRGDSMVVKAPTGSGKTLAYLIPILNDLEFELATQAVIVVPTKVLANQVLSVLRKFKARGIEVTASAILDGSTAENKTRSHIIITTPVLALNLPHFADLSHLKRTVLDEGDMLLFGGFYSEVEQLLNYGFKGSTAIFTASIDEHLDTLVRRYIKASSLIDVTGDAITSTNVAHHFINIKNRTKAQALVEFLKAHNPYKAIIFASNKKDLDPLYQALEQGGYKFSFVHGDLPKRDQKRALSDFIRDDTHILLASDIASRGVDIPEVTDVISVDLPKDLIYYFHRAGRSGRFDRAGNSYVFYSPEEVTRCKELLKKGTKFDYFTLKEGVLKPDRDLAVLEKTRKVNTVLEAEIAKVVRKTRSTKVKPNYKKKVKKAVERTKEKHRRKIIRSNLAEKNKD